jgi:hypothetical protein
MGGLNQALPFVVTFTYQEEPVEPPWLASWPFVYFCEIRGDRKRECRLIAQLAC